MVGDKVVLRKILPPRFERYYHPVAGPMIFAEINEGLQGHLGEEFLVSETDDPEGEEMVGIRHLFPERISEDDRLQIAETYLFPLECFK